VACANGTVVLEIKNFMNCVAAQYKLTTAQFQEWVKRLSHKGATFSAISNFQHPFQKLGWLEHVTDSQTYPTFFKFKQGTYKTHNFPRVE
jgi:hypothetical protein